MTTKLAPSRSIITTQTTTTQPIHVISQKRSVAPIVSAAATDIIRMLQSAAVQRRAGIDGGWGDESFRDLGFLHQVVGMALFPDLWDAYAVSLSAYMVKSFGQITDPGAPGYLIWPSLDPENAPQLQLFPQAAPPPMDPHLCAWDERPDLFAVQIERVRQNLRFFLAWWGLTVPAEGSPSTIPPPPTTFEAGVSQALGVDLISELRSYYDIPILGWCLAIISLIIEIAYAIFGTASAVETQAVPLAEGELDAWDQAMAATTMLLRGIEGQSRALKLGHALTSEALYARPAASPASRRTRQVVAVTVGTGLALALVWVLLA